MALPSSLTVRAPIALCNKSASLSTGIALPSSVEISPKTLGLSFIVLELLAQGVALRFCLGLALLLAAMAAAATMAARAHRRARASPGARRLRGVRARGGRAAWPAVPHGGDALRVRVGGSIGAAAVSEPRGRARFALRRGLGGEAPTPGQKATRLAAAAARAGRRRRRPPRRRPPATLTAKGLAYSGLLAVATAALRRAWKSKCAHAIAHGGLLPEHDDEACACAAAGGSQGRARRGSPRRRPPARRRRRARRRWQVAAHDALAVEHVSQLRMTNSRRSPDRRPTVQITTICTPHSEAASAFSRAFSK